MNCPNQPFQNIIISKVLLSHFAELRIKSKITLRNLNKLTSIETGRLLYASMKLQLSEFFLDSQLGRHSFCTKDYKLKWQPGNQWLVWRLEQFQRVAVGVDYD